MTLPMATSSRPRMLDTSDVTTSGSPVPAGDDGQADDPLGHPPGPPELDGPGDGRVGPGDEQADARRDQDEARPSRAARGRLAWVSSLTSVRSSFTSPAFICLRTRPTR